MKMSDSMYFWKNGKYFLNLYIYSLYNPPYSKGFGLRSRPKAFWGRKQNCNTYPLYLYATDLFFCSYLAINKVYSERIITFFVFLICFVCFSQVLGSMACLHQFWHTSAPNTLWFMFLVQKQCANAYFWLFYQGNGFK